MTLEVYNVTGVRIMNVKIDSYDKVIDLALAKGCYIVKIENQAKTKTFVRKVTIL